MMDNMMDKRQTAILIAVAILLGGIFAYRSIGVERTGEDATRISDSYILEDDTDSDLPVQTDGPHPDTETDKHDYSETRASYIFEQFDMSPAQYIFVWSYELLDYVETAEYTYILGAMSLQPGTTSPSFFIGDDTIFGVCQDVDAVNYLYEFTRDTRGTWGLNEARQLQDTGRYQDIQQSFSEYQESVDVSNVT